jgi:hypothetical protein
VFNNKLCGHSLPCRLLAAIALDVWHSGYPSQQNPLI